MTYPAAVSCSAGAATARTALRVLLPLRPAATRSTAAALSGPTTTTSTRSITLPSHSGAPLRWQQPLQQPQLQHLPRHHYHSHTHPPAPGPFTPAEQTLLAAAYKHVPAHGFTPESLALGARGAGLLDISASILPDGGVFSLIRWHLYTQRTALAGKKAGLFQGTEDVMSVAEKVEALAWARLKGNVDGIGVDGNEKGNGSGEQGRGVLGRWQEALAVMAQPSYVPASLKELALLADEILYLAGDVSVDPTWYTKRASLSAAYAAAELFMTTDQSPGFRETRAFLRRRLDEAARAGGAVRAAGEWFGFTASAAVNVLRSKGVRI
ncbi:Ubiquinone biosynthesis protein coq9, mitochondrial [Madurella fahalii]|uniref:Ubiquinone biosynthesis protein n=1 Tax=Madurella fahalii TaxID=1157608 RepID=A0ABQ0GHN3_9PEZI